MDPSLEFAQAVLDQLRRGLKRFAPGRVGKTAEALGRSRNHFQRWSADSIRLDEAAAVARASDFKLVERFRLLTIPTPRIPEGAAGFFSRHGLLATDNEQCGFIHLQSFLEWGFQVRLQPSDDPLYLDLKARLGSFGVSDPSPDLVRSYAEILFQCLASEGPSTLSYRSARELIETLLLVVQKLPEKRCAFRGASQMIALSFYWESFLGDLDIRKRLFRAGAHVSRRLGFPSDTLWSFRQALYAAGLTADIKEVESIRSEARDVIDSDFVELSKRLGTGSTSLAGLDLKSIGRTEQQLLLRVLESDRFTSPIGAAELDRRLGGLRAFPNALSGRRPMTVKRWYSLVETLDLPLEHLMDRAAAMDPLPPPVGNLFQALKISKPHRVLHPFQKDLLAWSAKVDVSNDAPRLEIDRDACSKAQEGEASYRSVLQTLKTIQESSPGRIHPDDGAVLCEGLLRICYRLQHGSWLDDAVDFLTIAMRLHESARNLKGLAMAYRSGAYLALDLGRPQISLIALGRAKDLDLWVGTLEGLSLTIYAESTVIRATGNYSEAFELYRHCLHLLRNGFCPITEWWLQLSMASTALQLKNVPLALEYLLKAENVFSDDSASASAELFNTKGDILSQAGFYDEPMQLFSMATSRLDPEHNARDLVLIGLTKCNHLIRHRRFEKARQETKDLLRFGPHLRNNPIGIQALQQIVAQTLSGSLDEESVLRAQERLKYPNLCRGRID